MKHKEISLYLIVDIRNGEHRVRKTKPKKTKYPGPFKHVLKINCTFNIPEHPIQEANIEVDLSKDNVQKMTAEKL